ncbi:hypothetical protein HMPREF2087_00235 [Helicobacter canis NCTC 12740]|uniref:Uncharacterized protein n=1 Tax=Helicobacter canis NCTC 12740 TaxID=1357399 RepID=V8CIT2_9HELI|nr:hypothetical protein HMPREF2087_00235 [Helicobacter canis NCTC 12740]
MGFSHCEAQPKQSINELESSVKMDCHALQARLAMTKDKL